MYIHTYKVHIGRYVHTYVHTYICTISHISYNLPRPGGRNRAPRAGTRVDQTHKSALGPALRAPRGARDWAQEPPLSRGGIGHWAMSLVDETRKLGGERTRCIRST